MPFAKLAKDELDAIARKVLDQLQRSDNHPIPSTQGMTFAQIERRSRQVAQAVATHLTAEALANASDAQATNADCPQCHTTSRVTRQQRPITTLDGPVEYDEPVAHCVVCRCDFFPSASPAATE